MGMQGARETPVGALKRRADIAVQQSKPWIVAVGRLGYACRGIVHILIGVLAARAAMGPGGKTTDGRGALATMVGQPLGSLLLLLIASGLAGYALCRIIEALVDPDRKGSDLKGIGKRFKHAFSGFVYAGLALAAVKMIVGAAQKGGERSVDEWTAWLIKQPFGQWLVAAAGVVVIGIGLAGLYVAWKAPFRKTLHLHRMSELQQCWAILAGRIGFAARGLVFGLIGLFLIQAALDREPGEARGLGGAMSALEQEPSGPWLLGAVAAGMILYGVYQLVEARYRRILQS
jgi:hypothetical protein